MMPVLPRPAAWSVSGLPSVVQAHKLSDMGLTHYWQRPPSLPAAPFQKAVADCRLLLGRLNVPLAGPDGTGAPIFNDNSIRFNDTAPANCEPFEIDCNHTGYVREGRGRSFCKTLHAPYDLWVTLALIVLKHHLDHNIDVSSDAHEAEWENARHICVEHLGYGAEFRLSVE